MRETSFGAMRSLTLPVALASDCEVMEFTRTGRPHSHERVEIAIVVHGRGAVIVDGVRHDVQEGDYVYIPARAEHYMVPDDDGLSMLIAYEREVTP